MATITPADRVYNLNVELNAAKRDKKDVVKAHSENIKRIQAEIDSILEEDTTTTS